MFEAVPVLFRNDPKRHGCLGNAPSYVDKARIVGDTTLQLGGETFAAARTIYSATKTPSANAALRKAANDLAKRYGRRKKADDTTPTDPAAPPTTTAHS